MINNMTATCASLPTSERSICKEVVFEWKVGLRNVSVVNDFYKVQNSTCSCSNPVHRGSEMHAYIKQVHRVSKTQGSDGTSTWSTIRDAFTAVFHLAI
jgi:hypothetical protein